MIVHIFYSSIKVFLGGQKTIHNDTLLCVRERGLQFGKTQEGKIMRPRSFFHPGLHLQLYPIISTSHTPCPQNTFVQASSPYEKSN